jgi:hypothetical protein
VYVVTQRAVTKGAHAGLPKFRNEPWSRQHCNAATLSSVVGGWMRDADNDPLRPEDVDALAVRYELQRSDVLIDARLFERWQAPEAELREEFMRRHLWPRDLAGQYLTELRHALVRGD